MRTSSLILVGLLLLSITAQADEGRTGKFMLGLFGGWSMPVEKKDGVLTGDNDFSITDSQESMWGTFGAMAGYMGASGYGFEIETQFLNTNVYAQEMDNINIGNLKSVEIVFLGRIQTVPFDWEGWSFHITGGFGFSLNRFSRDVGIDLLEQSAGAAVSVGSGIGFVSDCSIGVAYYITNYLSVEVDAKINVNLAPMHWHAGHEKLNVTDLTYVAGQFVAGINFWL